MYPTTLMNEWMNEWIKHATRGTRFIHEKPLIAILIAVSGINLVCYQNTTINSVLLRIMRRDKLNLIASNSPLCLHTLKHKTS